MKTKTTPKGTAPVSASDMENFLANGKTFTIDAQRGDKMVYYNGVRMTTATALARLAKEIRTFNKEMAR